MEAARPPGELRVIKLSFFSLGFSTQHRSCPVYFSQPFKKVTSELAVNFTGAKQRSS